MAYRRRNYSRRRSYRPRVRMGKVFRTKKESLDATNMSEIKELHLCESAGTKCPKCKSPVRPPEYIEGHDVFHYRCECGYEWIE